MNRKLKLIILASSLLASNALAADTDNFYIKGGVGLNSLYPFHVQEDEHTTKAKILHSFPLVEVGIGYSFSDRLRAEVVYDYLFKFNTKESLNHDTVVADFTRNTNIKALFLNSTLDIIKLENVSFFAGGGIGNAFHKEKIESLAINLEEFGRASQTNKRKDQLAYKLTAGIDFKLNQNTNLELAYNYFDLGKNKSGFKYKLNNITLGIRYSL